MNPTEQEWLRLYPNFAPDRIIADFIPLLGEAWEQKKGLFKQSSREDTITRTLCGWIIHHIRNRYNAWGVETQPELLEDKDGLDELIGRCDMTITIAAQKYIFECKRMIFNSDSQSYSMYAYRYVTLGMHRFLKPSNKQSGGTPQYPSWCGLAGMVAYVLEGTVQDAVACIHNAIDTHASPEIFEAESQPVCPSNGAQHFLTAHITCAQTPVNMHHIVLGVSG
jgi:hypothetical protein